MAHFIKAELKLKNSNYFPNEPYHRYKYCFDLLQNFALIESGIDRKKRLGKIYWAKSIKCRLQISE